MVEIGLGSPVNKDGRGVAARLAAFEHIAPLGGRDLLDYGCGNGIYTLKLADHFDTVAAVDVQAQLLEEARRLAADKRMAVDFRLGGDTLPFPDESFDVVTMIEVLEHVTDERCSLAEIRRVLRPHGRVYISVPNRLFPIETHEIRLRGKWVSGRQLPGLPWLPPIHRRIAGARTYTPRSLAALLASVGFSMSQPQFIMPPLDNWRPELKWPRRLLSLLERSPLRRFGVSILAVARPMGERSLPS